MQIPIWKVWGETQDSAFLINSQVIPDLWVINPILNKQDIYFVIKEYVYIYFFLYKYMKKFLDYTQEVISK